MPILGVTVAIFKDKRLLLTQREDFDVWCLPGGGIEDGESPGLAARREALEEVGLEVELKRLVGIYSDPELLHFGGHSIVVAGQPLGLEIHPDPSEVIEVRLFGADELPQVFQFGNRQRFLDALSGVGGSIIRVQNIAWPFDQPLTRQDIYALRDRSNLSRAEFYHQYMGRALVPPDLMEINSNGVKNL